MKKKRRSELPKQDFLWVPRFKRVLAVPLAVSGVSALAFVALRLSGAEFYTGPSDEALLGIDEGKLLWIDVILVIHLLFTATIALLGRWRVPWRRTDPPRRLLVFESVPPYWSHRFAAVAAGTLAIPHGSYGPAWMPFFSALHGAGLVALTSAAVWSWVMWILRGRWLELGPDTEGSSFHASGSILLVESEGRTALVRVAGFQDVAWSPKSMLVERRIPTYRDSGQERNPDFSPRARRRQPTFGGLTLPHSLSRWFELGLFLTLPLLLFAVVAAAAYGAVWLLWSALEALGGLHVGAALFLLVAACGTAGLAALLAVLSVRVVRRRDAWNSSRDYFDLRTWSWPTGFLPGPAVAVGSAVFAWAVLFRGIRGSFGDGAAFSGAGSVAPSELAILALAAVLWLPFWADFRESRLLLRLREGRLQVRRLGAWLPLTDALAGEAGELHLATGPSTVSVEPARWRGGPYDARLLAERLRPHLSLWSTEQGTARSKARGGEERR